MKNILLLLVVFVALNGYTQHSSAVITFKKTIQINASQSSDKQTNENFKALNNLSGQVEYILRINNRKSHFYYTNNLPLELDEHSIKYIIGKGDSSGNFFISMEDRIITRHISFLGEDFNITSNVDSINWNLTTESKMIGTYKCYKATTIKTVKNDKGIFKHPVVAWYAPEIPMNFGPTNFAGLPGLILELSYQDVQFNASEIIVNPKQKIKIPKIPKAKEVTNDEYNEIIKKLISQYRKSLFD